MKSKKLTKTGIGLSLLIAMCCLGLGRPAWAADKGAGDDGRQNGQVRVQRQQHGFTGLLYKVWSRLRALNPVVHSRRTHRHAVVTMGIRGAETTGSLIEPYWKGDQSEDPAYIAELQRYTQAQNDAENGELEKAVAEFKAFLKTYKNSELRPNAVFALGLSQAGMGDTTAGKQTLRRFIKENPAHPLVKDAKQVLSSL